MRCPDTETEQVDPWLWVQKKVLEGDLNFGGLVDHKRVCVLGSKILGALVRLFIQYQWCRKTWKWWHRVAWWEMDSSEMRPIHSAKCCLQWYMIGSENGTMTPWKLLFNWTLSKELTRICSINLTKNKRQPIERVLRWSFIREMRRLFKTRFFFKLINLNTLELH